MYNKDKTTISQNSSTKHSAFNIYQLFPQRTEDKCLAELKQYPKLYWTYKNWPDDWKKRFMEFMKGKKSLPLTYIYLHHGRTIFNTGVNLSLLQEYYVVNLDVFKNSKYAKDINDLNAWLSLLTADSTDNLTTLISNYPWMESICQDISEYLYRPEEVISMFSKALKKMDENTVNFMIEQMKKALEEKDVALSEKDAALSEKDVALSEKDAEIAALQAKLAALEH